MGSLALSEGGYHLPLVDLGSLLLSFSPNSSGAYICLDSEVCGMNFTEETSSGVDKLSMKEVLSPIIFIKRWYLFI